MALHRRDHATRRRGVAAVAVVVLVVVAAVLAAWTGVTTAAAAVATGPALMAPGAGAARPPAGDAGLLSPDAWRWLHPLTGALPVDTGDEAAGASALAFLHGLDGEPLPSLTDFLDDFVRPRALLPFFGAEADGRDAPHDPGEHDHEDPAAGAPAAGGGRWWAPDLSSLGVRTRAIVGAVPEPTPLLLAGLALLVVGALRSRL